MQMILHHVGQMNVADITFGDLTVFVGPQATGKSIALQFLKLLVDTGHIQEVMDKYGLDWSGKVVAEFFDIYFGEGMGSIWRDGVSTVAWDGDAVDMKNLVR